MEDDGRGIIIRKTRRGRSLEVVCLDELARNIQHRGRYTVSLKALMAATLVLHRTKDVEQAIAAAENYVRRAGYRVDNG